MSDEKTRILNMLASGKINVEQAEKLLKAVEPEDQQSSTPAVITKKQPKFIRVQVDSSSGDKVNIKVPIQILRSGVKLASLLPSEAKGGLNNKFKGLDLNNIGPENIDEFIESLSELTLNVDGSDKVRIFCE